MGGRSFRRLRSSLMEDRRTCDILMFCPPITIQKGLSATARTLAGSPLRAKKAVRTRTAGKAGSGGVLPERPLTRYLVLWWHLQKMYVGLFENETEATLHAAARNGVVVELIGSSVSIGAIEDYWRRDDTGRPMPGEWRTSRVVVTA